MPSETIDDAHRMLAAAIPRLRRFALSLTGSWSEADDLTQDTLERALMRLELWSPEGKIENWACRIMQNVWIDTLRARKTRAKFNEPDEGQDAIGVDGRSAMHARLELMDMVKIFQELPADLRSAAALILVEGYSYKEAAEILDAPEGTICSRLARARAYLDRRLAGQEVPQ